MLVFLRHAERGDNEFPIQHSEIPFDPPITTESKATIAKTAEQLLQVFQKQKIEKVRIVCSKFLRCLMTAQQIAAIIQKAGMTVIHPFVIDTQVGEYMREDWFKQYPLESLIYDGIYRGKYINDEPWAEKKLQKRFPFPQNYVMFHERVGKYKAKLKFPAAGEATLIVTHGFVVRQMCWRMNHGPPIMAEVPYCGYAVFEHDGKQDILIKARL